MQVVLSYQDSYHNNVNLNLSLLHTGIRPYSMTLKITLHMVT